MSVSAQNPVPTCGTSVTITNIYGQNGQFYMWVNDPTLPANQDPVIAQTFTLGLSNGQMTFSLRQDQNGNPVNIRPGVTYSLTLETYGPGVCCGAFSNYTLALTQDLMFTNLGSLPSGATCSNTYTCSGFLPPGSSSGNTFYFMVNNSGTSCPVMLDPVPALINSTQTNLISQDATTLAQFGRKVASIAADGVTRVVLRIPAVTASDQIYVSVVNVVGGQDVPSNSVSDDGGLDVISGQNFVSAVSSPLTVTQPVGGSSPYMAFALYQAPVDFVRAGQPVPCTDPSYCDSAQSTRTVYIQVQNGQINYLFPISIVRPPIVLVHGLTANASAWDTFTPFILSPLFGIYRSNYGKQIANVSAIVPNYTSPQTNEPLLDSRAVIGSELGFRFNAPVVLEDIQRSIKDYKLSGPTAFPTTVASVQADIVAHSMGGLITRMAARSEPTFFSAYNYWQGPVHKMITLGTPHLGSPNGIQSLNGRSDNMCLMTLLALVGTFELQSAVVSGDVVNGGPLDLQGDGKGVVLSDALRSLQTPALQPMVIAPIAGTVSTQQYNNLNGSTLKRISDSVCLNLTLPYSPNSIPQNYSSTGWPILMAGYTDSEWQSGLPGVPSDGVVPLTSALNNGSSYTAANAGSPDPQSGINTFDGVVHSPGVSIEGFGDPYLQLNGAGSPVLVTDRVLQLLNTSITAPVFQLFP